MRGKEKKGQNRRIKENIDNNLNMDSFEAELARATDPLEGHLLGAVAMVIDNKGTK